MKTSGNAMVTERGQRAIQDLGRLIQRARKAKGITQQDLAQRARISLRTLSNLEKGAPGVALWVLVNTMEVLGLLKHIEGLRDPATDAFLGDALPKRVRRPTLPENPDF